MSFQTHPSKTSYNYAYFPVLFDSSLIGVTRDDIYLILKSCQIYPRKYFYPLTSEFDCYKERFNASSTPVAQFIARNILTLPLYSQLPLLEVDRICDLICSAFKKG